MYNCGLVSVSFRGLSPVQVVNAAVAAKLSCIEWGSDVHAPSADKQNLESIASLCRDNGISVCSYGTYFRIGQNKPDELDAYIEAAKILGTDVLRLWCGTKGYDEYNDDEWDALINECELLNKKAVENNVTLCMECHGGTVTDTLEGALRLIRKINSENFRMYWQPNQHKTFEENMKYAENIAPYTKHIHVFNWNASERFPLASAKDVWKKYLSMFDKNRCLLLEFMPDDSPKSLANEAKALYEIVGEML